MATTQKILLVEDDLLVRMDAVQILEEAGYRVIEASDADEGLRVILADPKAIDILVTDVHMPGTIDGCGLAREVDERWPHIRIVVNSARADLSDDDMPDHGRFVSKPWTANAMLDAVEAAGQPRR